MCHVLNIYFTFRMTKLVKLEFVIMDVSENNYLSSVIDAELHLSANGLEVNIDL